MTHHRKRTLSYSSSDDFDDFDEEQFLPKIKRRRRFSAEETQVLEKEYSKNPSPTQDKIQAIANKLNNTPRKIVTTWFQNRRAKYKRRERQLEKSLMVSAKRPAKRIRESSSDYDSSSPESESDSASSASTKSSVSSEDEEHSDDQSSDEEEDQEDSASKNGRNFDNINIDLTRRQNNQVIKYPYWSCPSNQVDLSTSSFDMDRIARTLMNNQIRQQSFVFAPTDNANTNNYYQNHFIMPQNNNQQFNINIYNNTNTNYFWPQEQFFVPQNQHNIRDLTPLPQNQQPFLSVFNPYDFTAMISTGQGTTPNYILSSSSHELVNENSNSNSVQCIKPTDTYLIMDTEDTLQAQSDVWN